MHRVYVSMLVPCEIYLPPKQILHISDTPLLDVCNSYLEYSEDIRIPQGLRVVSDGIFEGLSEAEEWGRDLAMSWAGLLCFAMGVKSVFPRPLCLLEKLDKMGRCRMRRYWYDVLPPESGRPLSVDIATSIHERLSSLPDSEDSDRVGLAIRWYLIGLGETDDSMRFLAYWIGLEAIGDLLHRRLHKADRAACAICDHEAGRDHRGSEGGMKHVLSIVSKRSGLYQELDDARDKIFHGLQDLRELMGAITRNVGFLETALGRGILQVINLQESGESTSAIEPMRTVGVIPQVILEATAIDLSDEERDLLLYADPIGLSAKVVSVENEQDGKLLMQVSYSLSGPESLLPRLVDRKVQLISLPGTELQMADNQDTGDAQNSL